MVATAMGGFDVSLFAPSGETFTRAAVATIGVQKDTHGYWIHALQVRRYGWKSPFLNIKLPNIVRCKNRRITLTQLGSSPLLLY